MVSRSGESEHRRRARGGTVPTDTPYSIRRAFRDGSDLRGDVGGNCGGGTTDRGWSGRVREDPGPEVDDDDGEGRGVGRTDGNVTWGWDGECEERSVRRIYVE